MNLFKKKKTEVVEESKKPEKEEIMLEKNPTIEKENILDEEEPTKDIDPSEILNYLKQFSRLLPKLEEKREYSKKRIHQIEDKISEVEDLIQKLEEKKDNLHDEIRHVEEEAAKIDEIRSILQGIMGEKEAALTAVPKI